MKAGKPQIGRDVVINGKSFPVIEAGELFIEIPDQRFKWGVRQLVREWVISPMPVKNGPGVIPETIWYTGADIQEITWNLCEGPKCKCTIKMADGSLADYAAPTVEDVSVKQRLSAVLEQKSPSGRPGRHAIHTDTAIESACAWIYKLHQQDGMNQIPAAKKAIKKHHLTLSPGWLLQKYRDKKPTYWEEVLNRIQSPKT